MSKNSAAIIKSTREQINCKQPYYQTILVRFHLVPSSIPAQNRKKKKYSEENFLMEGPNTHTQGDAVNTSSCMA